jgi:repressor LexA
MKNLTKKQIRILNFIKDYIEAKKFPPTFREISERFNISVKGAYDHIKALERKGYLRCENHRSRALEVLHQNNNESDSLIKIPILGRVAAGSPLFAEENFEGTIDIPQEFVRNGSFFALYVQGDSMINAGILNADLAIIRHQPSAENGEIIVAMIDEAVTLKTFFREKNRIKLQAENPAYPPIFTQQIRILGKLVHIIRSYE